MCAGVPDCPDFGNHVTLEKEIQRQLDYYYLKTEL